MSRQPIQSFQSALDEARRRDRDAAEGPALRSPSLRARVDFGPAPGSGGEARFGLALDWTGEQADRPAPQPPESEPAGEAVLARMDTPAEIAQALGLDATLTAPQLAARWREFVWRNHPDRQPADARERANARVAIANALYQRARRELARGR